ncbi:hypothetical protein CYLTODRAFT_434176 [Cylindrobasidium torrendii FP15055 ss-10]|uniref:Wbp11/ELF5/Saf1 N-terminal domain-containing protein n=1 Tax=Cylindrobasidium torrendii FP15055 ss-10 TaxID=1314674 RepID=A0A0D7BTC7_9AGAR|nr:hypothetical protein CYLTODRAFT_434176 [Cylindrobasidium torrendii FP15055 ss-10]
MGKNSNPADAFRKAQRKKELKKNKATRKNTRDFQLVKQDTWDLQDEIERLESVGKPDDRDKARLAELKAELERINKKKAEWVEEHPEHRRLVYRGRKETDTSKLEHALATAKPKRNYFRANGLPRHPERSIYYDAVMNPYGVAPPGMPYKERDLLPGEVDSEAEDEDVPMPDVLLPNGEMPIGPDEDIPLPDGPAPGEEVMEDFSLPPMPSMPPPLLLPNGVPPPPPPPGFMAPIGVPPPPPGPPPNFVLTSMPPPPPPNFIPGMGVAPPGFFPRGNSGLDAISRSPQTVQGHKSQPLPAPHPSLPPKPTNKPIHTGTTSASAVISAEPQLRDLKAEATSFMPASLKKHATKKNGNSRINAAPGLGEDDDKTPRPDLLSVLANQFGPVPTPPAASRPVAEPVTSTSKDDYAKFVNEMGDILGAK